ncbi:MAG: enoyl-CoA hydratase-related protein [Thermomicrobium sp.]|nr:enoyl-CoA hydratase-related protein [Thermomicrobium sp.]MDW8059890.1 enoyl-CoA hydratase-related protein [Thermomicrobium sp.]
MSELLVERTGTIATVVLNRPERLNALTLAMWRELARTVRALADEPGVRVVVLRGAGERAFSAGADIREFPEVRTGRAAAASYDRTVAAALQAIQEIPQPVVAVLRGIVVGGGLELAAACDVRLASEDARLGLPIGQLGVMPGLGECRALLRLLPAGKIVELVLRNELLDAQKAHRLGLVTEVVPVDRLEQRLQEWCDRLAGLSPDTVRATKAVLRLAASGRDESDERYQQLLELVYGGEAYREGVQAFLEKRTPDFRTRRGR